MARRAFSCPSKDGMELLCFWPKVVMMEWDHDMSIVLGFRFGHIALVLSLFYASIALYLLARPL